MIVLRNKNTQKFCYKPLLQPNFWTILSLFRPECFITSSFVDIEAQFKTEQVISSEWLHLFLFETRNTVNRTRPKSISQEQRVLLKLQPMIRLIADLYKLAYHKFYINPPSLIGSPFQRNFKPPISFQHPLPILK